MSRMRISREEVERTVIARELVYVAKRLMGFSELELWKERLKDNEDDIRSYEQYLKKQGKTKDNKWIQEHLKRLKKHNVTLKNVIKNTKSEESMPKAARDMSAAVYTTRQFQKDLKGVYSELDKIDDNLMDIEDETLHPNLMQEFEVIKDKVKYLIGSPKWRG